MQLQVEIEFKDLVSLVKKLPRGKLHQLKAEIEKQGVEADKSMNLRMLLLSGPVASAKQLMLIENNRKSLNQWRIK